MSTSPSEDRSPGGPSKTKEPGNGLGVGTAIAVLSTCIIAVFGFLFYDVTKRDAYIDAYTNALKEATASQKDILNGSVDKVMDVAMETAKASVKATQVSETMKGLTDSAQQAVRDAEKAVKDANEALRDIQALRDGKVKEIAEQLLKDDKTRASLSKILSDYLENDSLPVGAVLPFYGDSTMAEAQRSRGWWICDGREVNEPLSPTFSGKRTPNLVGLFLRGDMRVGIQGGSPNVDIPEQEIRSATYSFGGPRFEMDPRVVVSDSRAWPAGQAILSLGKYNATTIDYMPPFMSVIYLLKVR